VIGEYYCELQIFNRKQIHQSHNSADAWHHDSETACAETDNQKVYAGKSKI